MLFVLKTFSAIIGCFVIYAALFMYEDEEGLWQNHIVDIWIRVDDKAKATGNKTLALFNQVGLSTTSILNRLFGDRLLSFRAVGTSTSCSLTLALITINLAKLVMGYDPPGFFLCAIFALPTIISICFPSRWLTPLSFIPLAIITCACFLIPGDLQHSPRLMLPCALLVSFFSDVFIVAIARWTVRQVAFDGKILQITILLGIQLLCVLGVVVFPFWISEPFSNYTSDYLDRPVIQNIWLLSAFLNIFTAAICLIMSVVMMIVLIHRLFWPSLARIIYVLERYKIIRNKKFLILIGASCLAFQFPHEIQKLLSSVFPEP